MKFYFINLLFVLNKIGTIQRFCQDNGTWAMTVPPDIQCQTCFGYGRPVKVQQKIINLKIKICFYYLV